MSPSWRDELQVLLQPQRVRVRRLARGLAPRVVAQREAEAGGGAQPAVQALAALLADLPTARAALRVTLSSHFVRYALLPPSDLLVSASDWTNFARQNFARIYGAAAESWQVVVDRGGNGHPAVACGIDAALIGALRDCAGRARATLVSLQPALMAAYNAVREKLAHPALRLLVVEPGIATVARIGDGAWRRLRTQRLDDDLSVALAALLERERILDEEPLEPELALYVPLGVPAASLGAEAGTVLPTAWAAFDAGPATATREAA